MANATSSLDITILHFIFCTRIIYNTEFDTRVLRKHRYHVKFWPKSHKVR
jgi:hypothetical protein